ncbi:MAG: fumarylacetoacetate hydrolase family protein, partial [Psychroflexus halocasei]
ELKNEKPTEPVVFMKPDSALLSKKQPFVIPEFSEDVHHEVELLVRINRLGKHIQPKFAHKYYDQIGIGLDFTARDLQSELKEKGLPWEKAKSFDGAAVVSNQWLSVSDFENLNDINFTLEKNNEIVQQGNSSQMLWKIDEIISYVSQYFTLKIGDIIFTGTPKGVGQVKPDDKLIAKIENKELINLNIK